MRLRTQKALTLGDWGFTPDPTGEAYSTLLCLLAGEEELAACFSNLRPCSQPFGLQASAFRSSRLRAPNLALNRGAPQRQSAGWCEAWRYLTTPSHRHRSAHPPCVSFVIEKLINAMSTCIATAAGRLQSGSVALRAVTAGGTGTPFKVTRRRRPPAAMQWRFSSFIIAVVVVVVVLCFLPPITSFTLIVLTECIVSDS